LNYYSPVTKKYFDNYQNTPYTLERGTPAALRLLEEWMVLGEDCKLPMLMQGNTHADVGVAFEACMDFIHVVSELEIPQAGLFITEVLKHRLSDSSSNITGAHIRALFGIYEVTHDVCQLVVDSTCHKMLTEKGTFATERASIPSYEKACINALLESVQSATLVNKTTGELIFYDKQDA
jgi:hypothetical protein